MQVDKLISLRFTESTDPIANEALDKLRSIRGKSLWIRRSRLLGVWYKCWLAEQQREYEGVAGNE